MQRVILVVDDSTTIQKVIRIAFSGFDVRLITAGSLPEASASLAQKPALILADPCLQGVRGVGDFKSMIAGAGSVPVILLIGSYDQVDEESFVREGFPHMLRKPFSADDVIRMAELALGIDLATGAASGSPSVPDIPVPPRGDSFESAVPAGGSSPGSVDGPPPVPVLSGKKGVRTFANDGDRPPPPPGAEGRKPADAAPPPAPAAAPPPIPAAGAPLDHEALRSIVAPLVREEVEARVRDLVEEFCARHFPGLARDVITSEIRRLSEERNRHLVDS